jgi:centromere protein J
MRGLEEDKSDLSSQLKIVSEENLMLQEKCSDLETRKRVNSGKSERKSSWEEINNLVSKKPVVMNETKFNQSNLVQHQSKMHKNQSKIPQNQSKLAPPQHKLTISNSQTTVDSYHTALNDSTGSNSNESQKSSNSQVDRISERDPDGTRRIRFLNTGTVKTVETNGIITVKFANGDVKTCYPEGVEGDSKKDVYFYCDTRTTETTFYDKADKVKIISFDDGQTEHYYKNGKKEIVFSDQSRRTILNNGLFEIMDLADGTQIETSFSNDKSGKIVSKKIKFTNGNVEEHTDEFRRRIFEDGTTKTIYTDGHTETRFLNGRIRIKDKEGNLIIDRVVQN